MKVFTKRSLAWLAALMMVISLLASVIVLPSSAATVEYVYSGDYIYNWGARGTLATFLSPNAIDFYEENQTSYAALSALSGASNTSSVPDSDLYEALHELMYSNLDTPTSYDATKNLFQYTDCENSAKTSAAISAFYSGKAVGPEWDGGSTWNREHTWPNSKSDSGSKKDTQREDDIMMLRPTASNVNSSRGNKAYGESGTCYNPNTASNNQYDLRGDVSRIVLYVYVCWGGSDQHDGALDYMWGADGVIESKEILLKWMEEDPVDTWELGRNDSVQSITGTRNVFVDYPELAFLLLDEQVPEDYDSPSGEGATLDYTVTATSNNTAYGTVAVNGNKVTATPKAGYEVSGYTILSGTATVTRSGNVFILSATSDVSVRINFAARQQLIVSFVQAGTTVTQTAYTGDTITLPAHSGAVQSGHTFVGWVTGAVSDTSDAPTYLQAGSSYAVSAATTLYALYSRTVSGGSGGNVFEKYSGTLTEGDYLITYNNGALIAEISSDRFKYIDISATADVISSPAEKAIWHIAKDGDHWTLYNASANAYAGGTGGKSKGKLLTSVTDFAKWAVTGNDTYDFANKGNQDKGVNYTLRRNGTYGFACYATATGGALTLYKRVSSTTYYFTAVACEHNFSTATCAKPATCTLCGAIQGEALPHTYDHGCDATCNVCGATRTPDAHVYTADCDVTCNVCGAQRTVSAGGESTITFDESKTQRVEYSNDTQVWQNGTLIVTNNKADSTNNVGNYSNPGRFYKSSQIIIAYPNMVALTIDAPTGDYGTPWGDMLTAAGLTYTENGGDYTVTFATPVDSITLTASAQVRAYIITAVSAGAEHVYDDDNDAECNVCGHVREIDSHTHTYESVVTTAPTCGVAGVKTYTCTQCDHSYTEAIAATGEHTYDYVCDAICNVCGAQRTAADHVYTADCDVTCNVCGAQRTVVAGEATTITFDGDATQRVECSDDTQIWQSGTLVITNNKTADSNKIVNYSNPVRFYKNSQIIITYPNMTALVIVANTASEGQYATPWGDTLIAAGLTYTVEDGVYTVTFATPVDSITLTASAQVRANSITAAAAGAGSLHTYDNACDASCNACGEIREVGDHVYDDDTDTDCNYCGFSRDVPAHIFSGGLTSASEEVNGLAFLFEAAISGAQVTVPQTYVSGSATITPYVGGESYAVVRLGALVTNNGTDFVDVQAKYLWSWEEDTVSFAIRITDIPDANKDVAITVRPYCVYVVDGVEMVVYGDAVTQSYNVAAQKMYEE